MILELSSQKIQVNEFSFEEFIDFCYDQIFQWGSTVLLRFIRSLRIILPFSALFHLKFLIQQVVEMELMTIYNLSNYENEELKISKENQYY
jgi:hypothetical protein